MKDALDILIDDPTSLILWVALALIASLINGLISLWRHRQVARSGHQAPPLDCLAHFLEFVIVVMIIALAFVCRLTVGVLLHAPIFFNCILIAVAGVECGRTFNRYLEMRGVSRRINLGKAIEKALGNTPAKNILETTNENELK